MPGIMRGLFDFNKDGKLSAFERAMEFQFLEDLEKNEYEDDDYDYDEDDGLSELELAGIDPEELEYMSVDARREILEEAGLSADDFDF